MHAAVPPSFSGLPLTGNAWTVLGLMSGTSLDGVDLALCRFRFENDPPAFELLRAETVPYDTAWQEHLAALPHASALDLAHAHVAFGETLGKMAADFIQRHNITEPVLAVASHGHTIFHQPDKKLSFQLGSGAALAVAAGIPAVCDFRSTDVALGGQGAPLVPIGDELLFGSYSACLNIGGIANVSFRENDRRIAYDIAPANMVLNALSRRLDLPYDKDGALAQSGQLIPELLEVLDLQSYYIALPPKSLGREDVEKTFFPLLDRSDVPVVDLLRTFTEHLARQIAASLPEAFNHLDSMLVTGGGGHNAFLIERIRAHSNCTIVVPEKDVVDFKEAIVFAFLGLLRILQKDNALQSVTGASRNSCGGAIYLP